MTPLGPPAAHHQVGPALQHGAGDRRQVGPVEGAVAVHEAHHFALGGQQAGEAGRPEPPLRFAHHHRPEAGGHLARAVGRAVVHHDGPVPGRDRRQHPGQGGPLVEHRQDDIDHRIWLTRR